MTAMPIRGGSRQRAPDVMIVDTNRYTRTVVSDFLLQIGVGKITVSRSGSEIERVCLGVAPHIVIAAADCGDVSGPDIARRLRLGGFPLSPETPMVLIAPGLCARQLQEIVGAGVDEVLIQPLSLDALRSRIRQVIYHRRPFIDSRHYIGPCRRRRVIKGYDGLLRRLCDDLERSEAGVGDEISYLARVYGMISGLQAAEWTIDGAGVTASDFYKLLSEYAHDVECSGSRELVRVWASATLYLQGTGATADGRDLAILREHMEISCAIAGMPNASHASLMGKVDELEKRSREMLHSTGEGLIARAS